MQTTHIFISFEEPENREFFNEWTLHIYKCRMFRNSLLLLLSLCTQIMCRWKHFFIWLELSTSFEWNIPPALLHQECETTVEPWARTKNSSYEWGNCDGFNGRLMACASWQGWGTGQSHRAAQVIPESTVQTHHHGVIRKLDGAQIWKLFVLF